MRNIRIGNDIRLKVELKQADGFDNILPLNNSNIKQLRCYLINTSVPHEPTVEEKKMFRRVGFPDFYRPTAHNINNAGFPSYHMLPANACNYDRFLPDFHDYHWWPGFRGFGLHPEHFDDICGHMWGIGQKPIMEAPEHPWYLADSKVLAKANTISCMFPAMEQKLCGTYKLVVVLTVYEHGWGKHNLRTFTLDKGDVFKLVNGENPSECGESGPIYIDVDNKGGNTGEIEHVFTKDTNVFYVGSDSELEIGLKDLQRNLYQLVVVLKDGSKILYNPNNWPFDNLLFESEHPDIVDVDANGTLYAKSLFLSYRNRKSSVHDPYYSKSVIIYKNDGDPYVSSQLGGYETLLDPYYYNKTIIYLDDGDPNANNSILNANEDTTVDGNKMVIEQATKYAQEDDFGIMHANEDTTYNNRTMIIQRNEGTGVFEARVRIYVKTSNSDKPSCWFTVIVREPDSIKMGFDEEDDARYIGPDDDFLRSYNPKDKYYIVPNNMIDGGYMWILSRQKIHYVKGMVIEDEMNCCCNDKKTKSGRKPYNIFKKELQEEITSDVSSGFRIPLISYDETVDGYYRYRSAAPIRDGNIKMKIKFE